MAVVGIADAPLHLVLLALVKAHGATKTAAAGASRQEGAVDDLSGQVDRRPGSVGWVARRMRPSWSSLIARRTETL